MGVRARVRVRVRGRDRVRDRVRGRVRVRVRVRAVSQVDAHLRAAAVGASEWMDAAHVEGVLLVISVGHARRGDGT